MPSITSWSRIEPRPRTDSIARSLAARVRDPLWFLTRQWQFGEFKGDDAGSPASVSFQASFTAIDDGWVGPAGTAAPFDRDSTPLVAVVQNEAFTLDVVSAVEMGQSFETIFARLYRALHPPPAPLEPLIQQFRDGYPV